MVTKCPRTIFYAKRVKKNSWRSRDHARKLEWVNFNIDQQIGHFLLSNLTCFSIRTGTTEWAGTCRVRRPARRFRLPSASHDSAILTRCHLRPRRAPKATISRRSLTPSRKTTKTFNKRTTNSRSQNKTNSAKLRIRPFRILFLLLQTKMVNKEMFINL